MSFTNVYYKRTAGTPRACYVCHKPSATVLATAATVDFLYTCDAHLTDAGFASRIDAPSPAPSSPSPSPISADAIAKIKEEYDAAQKRKKEREKEKGKGKEQDKDKDGGGADKSDDQKKGAADKDKSTDDTAASTTPPSAPTPTHEKYALHRHMFALRVDEHRRRRQAKEARTLAPRLPGAPTGSVG